MVTSPEQRLRVFRLRHDGFRAAGWIGPEECGALHDAFDDLPTTLITEAVADGKAVATLRIATRAAPGSHPQLPCEIEFPEALEAIADRYGPRIAEYSRVAIAPSITNTSFKTTLYGTLVRTALIISHAVELDYAVAAVHARIAPFYRYMIGFRHLTAAASYGQISEPTHLLGCDRATLFARARQRSGFFHIDDEEVERARSLIAFHHPELFERV